LPLLSYLLDDMWRDMVKRGDGVLRLPAQSIDLGRVLVQRADAFIAEHPQSEEKLRRRGARRCVPSSRRRSGGWPAISPITPTAFLSR
jgi:hypothetical protein